jgi:hypothetical protein
MGRPHTGAGARLRSTGPRRLLAAAGVAVGLAGLAGCGSEAEPEPPPTEAQTVTAGGFDWFAPLFRELNPRIAPDREILGSRRPAEGHAFWGAVVNVCNAREGSRRPPEGFRLVDAFGNAYRPLDLPARNAFAYEPRPLEKGACIPAPGSTAERATDGMVVVFEIPFEAADNRPLFLRLPPATAGRDGRPPQIELDV